MSNFMWNRAWNTGNSLIDEQHKKLYKQIEKLYIAFTEGKESIVTTGILTHMAMYIEVHFRDEEQLMLETNYPRYAEHKKIHDLLTAQVDQLVVDFHKGDPSISSKVLNFLKAWLEDHLSGEDHAFSDFIRTFDSCQYLRSLGVPAKVGRRVEIHYVLEPWLHKAKNPRTGTITGGDSQLYALMDGEKKARPLSPKFCITYYGEDGTILADFGDED